MGSTETQDDSPVVPVLTDGIVVLNGFTLDDVAAHLAGEDEEQARRFGWYPKHSTEETVRAAIVRWQDAWRAGSGRLAWAARHAGNLALVGGCEVKMYGDGRADMSWWIFPQFRRQGLATRAITLACDYALGRLNVRRIEAQIEPDNIGSRQAAENAGFVLQGRGPDEITDSGIRRAMLLYARTERAASKA